MTTIHRRLAPPFAALLLAFALAACSPPDDAAALTSAAGVPTFDDMLVVACADCDGDATAVIERDHVDLVDWSAVLHRRAPTPAWILYDAPLPVSVKSGCDAVTARFQEAVIAANTFQTHRSALDAGAPLLRVSARGAREYAAGTRAHRDARAAVDYARDAGYNRVMELIGLLDDAGCTDGGSR